MVSSSVEFELDVVYENKYESFLMFNTTDSFLKITIKTTYLKEKQNFQKKTKCANNFFVNF